MPGMFRIMKKDADDKPTIGQTATTLGIRPGEVDLDASGAVIVNDKGMSVNPEWRVASIFLIPKRLGTGGRGSNTSYCFRRGTDPFQQAACGAGLELFPDSPTHGVVRPAQLVLMAQYEADLHATRLEWEVDET
jgi:hypothetical protein